VVHPTTPFILIKWVLHNAARIVLQRTRFKLILRPLTKSYFGDWLCANSMVFAPWN
jgi:hypothetical protein